MANKSIGEILVLQKVISQADYETYLAASKQNESSFEKYVLEHNLVSDEALTRARGSKFGMPVIDIITDKMVDAAVLSKIPLKFLRENSIIPIKGAHDELMLVLHDPLNYQPADEMSAILGGQPPRALAQRAVIIGAINNYYPLEGTKEMIEELEAGEELAPQVDFAAIQEEDILAMASEAPIIKLVNHILYQAVKRDASDIHIEPFEKELHIRYRVDGVLYEAMMPPKRAQAAIISRIKIMANLNIAEKRQPQDGRIQIKVADKPFDIRVSVLPVTHGERIVLRLLDKSKTFGKLTEIGLSERDFSVLNHSITQPNGIVLVTGPTGSGKTTTLYSILSELNRPEVNIITVEDPVEYQMAGVGQVQVKESIGVTFAAALRSILRQDPDIIMIGETRDVETAQIAIQAALTGHLVFSTVHTNSAASTITRLLDMGIEPFLIASTVLSVTAQRLVRKLCVHCKRPYKPLPDVVKKLGITEKEAKSITFYEPVGCEECSHTGYRGRLALFEIMVMSPAIARLTMERADALVIQQQALKEGMTLLMGDGVRKIARGVTTIEEVLAVASSLEEHVE